MSVIGNSPRTLRHQDTAEHFPFKGVQNLHDISRRYGERLVKGGVGQRTKSAEMAEIMVDLEATGPAAIETTLLRLLAERGAGKALDPAEAARALGGPHPDGWGPLMQPIRQVAVRLAAEGRLVILRKGKPVDPAAFKGIYRLALPAEGEVVEGPGSSSEDLPVTQ
jgi:hypothetical protein